MAVAPAFRETKPSLVLVTEAILASTSATDFRQLLIACDASFCRDLQSPKALVHIFLVFVNSLFDVARLHAVNLLARVSRLASFQHVHDEVHVKHESIAALNKSILAMHEVAANASNVGTLETQAC